MPCLMCGGPLRPNWLVHWEQYDIEYGDPPKTKTCVRATSRVQAGMGYRGNGFFCSSFCGFDYGVKAAMQALADTEALP